MVKIVLEDLDSEVIERLKHRTDLQGMTPEDEIKRMLSLQFPISRTISREDRIARMNELKKRFAHLQKTDSVDLIREDRDR